MLAAGVSSWQQATFAAARTEDLMMSWASKTDLLLNLHNHYDSIHVNGAEYSDFSSNKNSSGASSGTCNTSLKDLFENALLSKEKDKKVLSMAGFKLTTTWFRDEHSKGRLGGEVCGGGRPWRGGTWNFSSVGCPGRELINNFPNWAMSCLAKKCKSLPKCTLSLPKFA